MSLRHIAYVNIGAGIYLGFYWAATSFGFDPIVTAGEGFVFGAVIGLALALDFEDDA